PSSGTPSVTEIAESLLPVDLGIRPLLPADFARVQRLLHEAAGIWIADGKQALVTGRLARRVRQLGLDSFGAYLDAVDQDRTGAERTLLIEAMCTHETAFFREPGQFAFLEGTLVPAWVAEARRGQRARRLRIWSAGCATGEEPYSIAMSLSAHLPPEEGWQVEILATDLSRRVLARARTGIWPLARAAAIPPGYLRRYMRRGRGAQQDRLAAGTALRRLIRFAPLNLAEGPYPIGATFDAIFCRNVLIYFDHDRRQRTHRHLLEALAPGGVLFLGHAETLHAEVGPVERLHPSIYRRRPS
ncbi:MAG TPA: protein-glutamate O-methyltransferase CheR, partial [Gemmatimonadales bacterium]|nr:protein-glutamate O-methyltransferase CheR [Gemmatimonadales bacterium]